VTRILITGGAGHLGRKLAAAFAGDGHDILRLDRTAAEGVIVADLAIWDESWTRHFEGVDAVVHLAGTPRPDASWFEVQTANIDLTLNVLEAAAQAGVKRLVFASSNWVLAGHRRDEGPLSGATPPYPINPYGASKLFGERLGKHYSERRGLSTIALRIGYCQHSEGNRPGPHMAHGLWGQSMWLSDEDLCEGFRCAITAPAGLAHAVLNLMSDNQGMRWDLSETRRAIGFEPRARSSPQATAELREQEDFVREALAMASGLTALLDRRRL
jgi:NAD(P)-dependent dehydrogenase (short-subunit alcohol dehydrogenase family)